MIFIISPLLRAFIFAIHSLIVEVKLSSAKSARIVVAHNEDPSVAVQKFAKIYGLENDAVHMLYTVVQQALQARNDAIARAQLAAEEAERRLLAEQARLAAEAAAEAEAEAAALHHHNHSGHGRRRQHRKKVVDENGNVSYIPYDDDGNGEFYDENGEEYSEDYDDDAEGDGLDGEDMDSSNNPPMMVLAGYDDYGQPIYAPAPNSNNNNNHHHHQNRSRRNRPRNQQEAAVAHAHSRDGSHSHHRGHHAGNNNHSHSYHSHHTGGGYDNHHTNYHHHNNMITGNMPRTLSEELDMIHVDEEYSSYTGTSSDLSDEDGDSEDDEDEDESDMEDSEMDEEDDDEDEEGDENGEEENEDGVVVKKPKTTRRRRSTKRPSILSQFF